MHQSADILQLQHTIFETSTHLCMHQIMSLDALNPHTHTHARTYRCTCASCARKSVGVHACGGKWMGAAAAAATRRHLAARAMIGPACGWASQMPVFVVGRWWCGMGWVGGSGRGSVCGGVWRLLYRTPPSSSRAARTPLRRLNHTTIRYRRTHHALDEGGEVHRECEGAVDPGQLGHVQEAPQEGLRPVGIRMCALFNELWRGRKDGRLR